MEAWNPAPYGRACTGCSRAKCKCFFRSGVPDCERCQRLGKQCEPNVAVRKRKADQQRARQPPPQPAQQKSQQEQHSVLEAKLDDIAALLGHLDTQRQAGAAGSASQTCQSSHDTPPIQSELVDSSDNRSDTVTGGPDLAIDSDGTVVHLLRAAQTQMDTNSGIGGADPVILEDVSVHRLSTQRGNEQLATFRRAFLSLFPLVHIPTSTSAADLRSQKPFLWLTIMAVTNPIVDEQFSMAETIWNVISHRVVAKQFASLDLLLGLICFAAWSHYFKMDKPFMTTITQIAVSMAYELDIHTDSPKHAISRVNTSTIPSQRMLKKPARTTEERRTIVALFHLSSTTWTAYRKTEPLRLTSYIKSCIQTIAEESETELDGLLAFQAKCHIITNQLTSAALDMGTDAETLAMPSKMVRAALLEQLDDARRSLPLSLLANRSMLLYQSSTELTIREKMLGAAKSPHGGGPAQLDRLAELESTLGCVERWLAHQWEIPLVDWPGNTVDNFAQFTHCLVVLFKLTVIEEPGWDSEEVKTRADVLRILDDYNDKVTQVPAAIKMVNSQGPRSGLFFKTPFLLKAIKALFAKSMGAVVDETIEQTGNDHQHEAYNTEDVSGTLFSDEFLMGLADEPWLADVFDLPWDFGAGLGDNNPFAQ